MSRNLISSPLVIFGAVLLLASCSITLGFSPAAPLQLRPSSFSVSAPSKLLVAQNSFGTRTVHLRKGFLMAEQSSPSDPEKEVTESVEDSEGVGEVSVEGAAEEEVDTTSPEFLKRKIEVLEKELQEATSKATSLEAEMAPLEELQAKGMLTAPSAIELKDTYIRLAADFENFRKRSGNDLIKATDTATANVVKELLTVLDNFERAGAAIKTETEKEEAINNSYQAVNKQLLSTLAKLKVEAIEPEGQEFDPNVHEAVTQAPSQEYKEGVVMQAMQRGYKIGERVVRPALVVVSAGPGPETASEDEAAPADDAAEAGEAKEEGAKEEEKKE